MSKSKVFGIIGGSVLTLSLAACGAHNDARGRGDAPVEQQIKTVVKVIPMPDHFPNVAYTCLQGNGIYVVTHDKTDTSPTVIPNDPVCTGKQ